MAVPLTYGVATHHLPQATLTALGALATTARPAGPAVDGRPGVRLVGTALVVTAAAYLGALVGGHGWASAVAIVALAALAAVVGGLSRWAADATARFVMFLVIASGLGAADPLEVAKWFALGAAWSTVLILATERRTQPEKASPAYLVRRWWSKLHHWEAWRYPLVLAACLAPVEAIAVLWHQQNVHWIALAVVIVLRRRGNSLLRATQRCLGTCGGVLLGAALILWVPPSWVVVAVVAILAGIRPLLKERNYTAYATVMTPLLVLLMDLGRTPHLSTVGYRLVDTIIGCTIAILPSVLRRTHVG